jgi:excinuclease ABC subunit A
VSARFPVGALTVVTGVSGAGKSTLVRGVLEEIARRSLRGLRPAAAGRASRAAWIGSRPCARWISFRSAVPRARHPPRTSASGRGSAASSLPRPRRGPAATGSAASRSTRRGALRGLPGPGRIRMEMSFLPDVRVDCEECRGRRFNAETLEVLYRGKSIADVLEMSVEERHRFFDAYRGPRAAAGGHERAGARVPHARTGEHDSLRRRGRSGEARGGAGQVGIGSVSSTSSTSRRPASTWRT